MILEVGMEIILSSGAYKELRAEAAAEETQ
jgi:hypothetical protein